MKTIAFRVRTTRENGIAVARAVDYGGLQDGGYIVKPGDLPLYQIQPCAEGKPGLCIRPLQAGETTKSHTYSMLPKIW